MKSLAARPQALRARMSRCRILRSSQAAPKSLFGNYEGRCGEGFWLWPRRRVPSIPAAGCKERVNAGHGQKTRRPEGFRGKGRLASLLLSRRSTRDILLRRACHPAFSPKTAPLVVSKQALTKGVHRSKCFGSTKLASPTGFAPVISC